MFCSWAINRHSCLYMKISKKDKALFDARIFLSYSSLIRSDFGKSSRALRFSPSYYSEFFPFFPLRRTTMWINEHRRCFNDRSIHTMNASCLFLYYYLAVRNNRAPFSLRNLNLVKSCRIWETFIDFDEATRNREIVLIKKKNPGRYILGDRSSRSILATSSIARKISSPSFPFKNL